MAVLIVGGVTVKVAGPDGVSEEYEDIGGDDARMFSGLMRSTVIAQKRRWNVTTKLLSTADFGTLKTALQGTPPVSCSGDVLGATIDCVPRLRSVEKMWAGGAVMHRLTFTLAEQ